MNRTGKPSGSSSSQTPPAFDREAIDPLRPFTLQLETAVHHGGEDVTELTFQPLRGKHIRAIQGTAGGGATVGAMMDLAARMTGQPPRVFDEMDVADLGRVNEVVAVFIARFLGTG